MPKKVGDRYFLSPGDIVSVKHGRLEYLGKERYKVSDLSNAELCFEDDYEIKYAWDLQVDDPNYEMPYFKK